MDRTDLDIRFAHHAPSSTAVGAAHGAVRSACREAAAAIDDFCPDSREKSLAVTNLEQAMMWANAAIARHQHAD